MMGEWGQWREILYRHANRCEEEEEEEEDEKKVKNESNTTTTTTSTFTTSDYQVTHMVYLTQIALFVICQKQSSILSFFLSGFMQCKCSSVSVVYMYVLPSSHF